MQDWQHSVIYQIYPKSFHSHAGNATGDLLGIVDKLDYLKWLGVDCLWITPFLRSPQRDNGYDISDYYAIDPSYGTMADCDLLISEAAQRGIKLMLDIVVNHTSIEHEWFQQARSSLDNPYRDFYIWRDQPNNWESKFGGSAWEYEAQTGQYFLHLFDHTQADLNWDNPKVRAEVFKLMRFWRDKGVGGFRLDVINLISKPADFPEDNSDGRRFYTDGPNVHAYLQEMHREVFEGHDLINVGEMSSTSLDNSSKSYRAVEFFDWQVTPRFGGQIEAVYQKDIRPGSQDQTWMSVGVRPAYAISEQFKLVTELGHDQVDASGGTRKLSKFTFAPTWSPKGPDFWARPEVRLYYTYASWNDAAKRAANELAAGSALSDTGAYGTARHGSNVGVQVEYWWK